MYTTKLTTNLKGQSRTYELTDKVLIVGDNEAGKSAITQSLQLAYSGAATGLLFRDEVKLASALLTMAPPDQGLDIIAVQDTGDKFSFSLLRGKKAKHAGPESCNVDSGDIREAFSGSTERMLGFIDKRISVEGYAEAQKNLVDAQARVKALKADMKTMEAQLEQVGNPELVKREALQALICQYGFTTAIRNLALVAGVDLRDALKLVSFAYGKEHFATAKEITLDTLIAKAKAVSDWKVIEQAVKAKDDIEIELVKATQAVDRAEKVYAQKALGLINTFAMWVQPYLQPGERLSVDLDTGYASLIRGDTGHAALSGSTEARVLAAMACALALPTLPGVIVLDDRMWSADNLVATMEALSNANCQVIITSTFAVPAPGWQTLHV